MQPMRNVPRPPSFPSPTRYSSVVVHDSSDWTREFATSTIRDGVAKVVDEATPGVAGRLSRNPNAYTELLTATNLVIEEAEKLLRKQVIAAHHAGLSWEQIGEALGINAFVAQQRFAGAPLAQNRAPVVPLPVGAGNQQLPPIGTLFVVEPGLFAGQELDCLNRAGQYGWHAVDRVSSRWTLAFDHQQWQHSVTSSETKTPYGDGWQQVVSQKKLVYWARPTNLPILPGNPPVKSFVSDRRVQRAVQRPH